jgi:SAM-dependent methyltransferase
MAVFDPKAVQALYRDDASVAAYLEEVDSIGLWASEQRLAERFFKKSDRILDIGCGAGRTTFHLYRLGYTGIIGLDYSEKMIAVCRQQAVARQMDIPFVRADARKLPYGQGAFDAVLFSFNGLMTIPGRDNRLQAMGEIFRVLKTGGVFLFSTHDRDNPAFRDIWTRYSRTWGTPRADRRLVDYGDLYFVERENGPEGFLHVPSQQEMLAFIGESGFVLEYFALRDSIAQESALLKQRAANNFFWVVKKPS